MLSMSYSLLGCWRNDITFVHHAWHCFNVRHDSSHYPISSRLTSLCHLDGVSLGKPIIQWIPNLNCSYLIHSFMGSTTMWTLRALALQLYCWVFALLHTSFVALGKLFNSFKPQFFHLEIEVILLIL